LLVRSDQFAATAEVGNTIRYSLIVSNRGPAAATGVVLTDSLPVGVRFVEASASRGAFTQAGGQVVFSLGRIEVGATATLTVAVQGQAAGTLTNRVVLSGAEPDPEAENNALEQRTQWIGGAQPELRVVLQGGNVQLSWPSAVVGLSLEYTDDLKESGWRSVSAGPQLDGGWFTVSESVKTKHRFYRLINGSSQPARTLSAVRVGANLTLAWPSSLTGYALESTDAFSPGVSWKRVLKTPVLDGSQLKVSETLEAGQKFYRLTSGSEF
jgi:uncharacterized repeat protein (TIGR01451 family)